METAFLLVIVFAGAGILICLILSLLLYLNTNKSPSGDRDVMLGGAIGLTVAVSTLLLFLFYNYLKFHVDLQLEMAGYILAGIFLGYYICFGLLNMLGRFKDPVCGIKSNPYVLRNTFGFRDDLARLLYNELIKGPDVNLYVLLNNQLLHVFASALVYKGIPLPNSRDFPVGLFARDSAYEFVIDEHRFGIRVVDA